MKIFNQNIFKLFLLAALALAALNFQAFAEIQPVESIPQTESAAPRLKLKAPIADEMSADEASSAEEDAKITEELNNAQKSLGEASPLNVEDKDFNPLGDETLTKDVVPNTSHELVKLIIMFGKVMLGVAVASVLIYFLLIFTKKFFHPPLPEKGEEDFDIRDLNSPKNMDEALQAFLDRTDD